LAREDRQVEDDPEGQPEGQDLARSQDRHRLEDGQRGAGDPAHRERHPFGKIPEFDHDGFRLYEAGAIARYVDERSRT